MRYKLLYKDAITRWEEALPLGNGKMGCLIWGSPDQLRFRVDRVDVWDTATPVGTESEEFTYQNLVRLAAEKNTDRIREIFDAPYQAPVPTKLPVGKIILRAPQYQHVESELKLSCGEAGLRLSGEAGTAEIQSILHATLGVGLIRVSLPLDAFEIMLLSPEFGRKEDARTKGYDAKSRAISQGSLKDIVYRAPERGQENVSAGSRIEYFWQETNTDFAYGIVLGIKGTAQETELFYRVVTSKDGADALNQALKDMRELMKQGYARLFPQHLKWWRDFWKESRISLPDKFMERNWYISNYLLASCSREGCFPMPLQGVWTADEDTLPPWKGDYHNDLNTQMSYYSYLKANHLSSGVNFWEFLWERREAGRIFAGRFYQTAGCCLPAVMTIDGKPLGGWPMYSLSPTNQIWLAKSFDDYYRYTGDRKFLLERAYPYFKETEACIGALLLEGEDGMLYLPVSSSPEIHDDEAEAFLTPNSNYDLALLHYLYETLERYACLLERLKEAERWKRRRERLSPLAVDERGVLMLAADEVLRESHRHFSHAHAIHPLRLIPYDTMEHRRIVDAVIKDLEGLGTSQWVGFSFCWMAELYAVAHRGEEAAKQLSVFWKYFCSSNGFHLNGDYQNKGYSTFTYHPFTLEANMCAADALQEMLLYTREDIIEPFPAVPKEWLEEELSYERLRAEGGILVSASGKNGRLTQLILESDSSRHVRIKGWRPDGTRASEESYPVTLHKGVNYFIKSP